MIRASEQVTLSEDLSETLVQPLSSLRIQRQLVKKSPQRGVRHISVIEFIEVHAYISLILVFGFIIAMAVVGMT